MKRLLITMFVMCTMLVLGDKAVFPTAQEAATLYKVALFNAGIEFESYWNNGKGSNTIKVTTTTTGGINKTTVKKHYGRIPRGLKEADGYKRGCRYVWYVVNGNTSIMYIRVKDTDFD